MEKSKASLSAAANKARERNWNKGKILGINSMAHKIYSSKTMTDQEKIDIGIIIDATSTLLRNW